MAIVATPTLDKMKLVNEQSQEIGDFVEWARDRGVALASVTPDGLAPHPDSIEKMLADYFGIDLREAEKERRALVAEARAQAERSVEVPRMHEVGKPKRADDGADDCCG